MEIGSDSDQRELRDSARGVLARHCPPTVTRASYDQPDLWRELWQTLVDLGWAAFATGDAEMGLGPRELVTVLEECGAATLPAPLVSSIGLAAGAIAAIGASGAEALDELSNGRIGTLLSSSANPRLPGVTLRRDGDRVIGTARAVPDAARASIFVALAEDATGTTSLAILQSSPGVVIVERESADPSRPLADVIVDAVPDVLVEASVQRTLAAPMLAAAAELLGVAARALDITVAHAISRRQFGQPIGAFQAVKHRLANTYVAIERARSLVYSAALLRGDPGAAPEQLWRAASLAKAAANDAATESTRACVAVHGAIAQCWEHDAHLLLRRAWVGTAALGESRALYASVARDFTRKVSA